jgi:hypothetical protein
MAKAFVTADGDYGVGVVVFDEDDLTTDQWEDVSNLFELDRDDYVEAILNGDEKTATRLLEESGLRQGSV